MKGYLFEVPIIRIITFWGLYWGPPILGNYPIDHMEVGAPRMRNQNTGLGFRVLGVRV